MENCNEDIKQSQNETGSKIKEFSLSFDMILRFLVITFFENNKKKEEEIYIKNKERIKMFKELYPFFM